MTDIKTLDNQQYIERTYDLALHPELTLAGRVDREFDPDTVADTVMYTNTEPSPMCTTRRAYAGLESDGVAVHAGY